jgi:diapolycopene oxygenase
MKAIVIGSGVAGLSSSIHLKLKGFDVTVFESNSYPGGKLHEFRAKGFRFDAGPSVSTMTFLMDDIFTLAGKNPRDYFNYHKKEIICKYFFNDGVRITGYYDRVKLLAEISEKLNIDTKPLNDYLEHCKKNHELAGEIFLKKSIHKASTFLTKKSLIAALNIKNLDIFTTLNEVNEKRLNHPKLIQIFNRYATFNGSDPYVAPGILNSIGHLEYGIGTYFIEGGFYSMTKSMYELALELGVKFHFNEYVEKILVENKKTTGIISKLNTYEAPIVVSNMDVVPTYRKLLSEEKQPEKILNQERSTSMMVFYWGVKGNYPELEFHNAIFTEDYRHEFDCLFNKKTVCDDPTIYINISSKEQPSDAPENHENWFVMVNVPANNGQNWDEIKKQTRKAIIKKINRILNISLEELIVFEDTLDPILIEQKTSSFQGSIYGASSNNMFAAFLRHANFSKRIKGLYFSGGSVHPGGGTPLCLLSGKITSEHIANDFN